MNTIELYQQVAEAYHTQNKFQERDRFLVLALDAAQTAGQNGLAEQIRSKLLELNPNHLIKPYSSSEAALQAPNFVTYLSQLRKNFPPAKAKALLQEMPEGIVARPKRTMLADASFPVADPVEDASTPTWSQVSIPSKQKAAVSTTFPAPRLPEPPVPIQKTPAPMQTLPMKTPNDPLANVPMTSATPPPFQFEQPARPKTAPARQPVIVPAPKRQAPGKLESPTSIWMGNMLFVVLFLTSIALLAYVFVLPFYPEVAKMLRPAS